MGLLSLKMSLRGKITPFGRASPVSRDYDPGISALTFDNLGEAADLERGLMAPDAAVGRHPSVTVALPRLLDELDMLGLRATFFVEGWNADVYPEALQGIAARGHEVGLHGWRHEAWAELPPDQEAELLLRGRDGLAALGIDVHAFRPPGGVPTPVTAGLLDALGFTWWSPVAGSAAEDDRPPEAVPFRWEHVDAYHVLETFEGRRGGPRRTPDEAAALLSAAPRDAVLVLHPFLMADDDGWAAARRVLAHVATTQRSPA
jgi:peptidoglycan/xylan/chitin deacetylase (PgdA/CDA1 family)